MFTYPIKKMMTALCFVAVAGASSTLVACHEELALLKADFAARESHLCDMHKIQKGALQCAHKETLEELRFARKAAAQLCRRERSVALKQIRCSRRDSIKAYDFSLRDLNKTHRATMHNLKDEFRVARKSLKCACNTPVVVASPVVPVFAPVVEPCIEPAPVVVPRPRCPDYQIERRVDITVPSSRPVTHHRPRIADRTVCDTPVFGIAEVCDVPNPRSNLVSMLMRMYATGYLGR